MDDKKGGLRKEFTYNRRKKDGEEGPPQAPPEEGMYNLGVVGSLLLLACTRSLEGGDVQIGCWLGVYCWWLVHALWTVGMYR